jgi:hypothetical protein
VNRSDISAKTLSRPQEAVWSSDGLISRGSTCLRQIALKDLRYIAIPSYRPRHDSERVVVEERTFSESGAAVALFWRQLLSKVVDFV